MDFNALSYTYLDFFIYLIKWESRGKFISKELVLLFPSEENLKDFLSNNYEEIHSFPCYDFVHCEYFKR